MHLQDAAAQLMGERVVLPMALSCLQRSRRKDRGDFLDKEHNGGSWRALKRQTREEGVRNVESCLKLPFGRALHCWKVEEQTSCHYR